jgi:SSS family solute:Na+ symporter
MGRVVTVAGVLVAIATALIASSYNNLMNYLQALFSIFNAPLFATFIIGMFWKRMTPAAALWGLIAGTISAAVLYVGYKFTGTFDFGTDLNESFWGAGSAFVVDAIVTVFVTYMTAPKPVAELRGLVWGMANRPAGAVGGALTLRGEAWYQSTAVLGGVALALGALFTILLW